MPTHPPETITGCYNMIAAMINMSVKEFNKGNPEQRHNAAAFFKSEWCEWLCDCVEATPQHIIANRLIADPFDESTWPENQKVRAVGGKKGVTVEYNGCEKTISQWAKEIGITENCFRVRLSRYGVCPEIFKRGRVRTSQINK